MSEQDRYAVYTVDAEGRHEIGATSAEGLGHWLIRLHDEDEFSGDGARVGVLDTKRRVWIIDPWKGTSLHHV